MQSITEQFKAFVASKPRDEEYDPWDNGEGERCGCALYQFLRAQGAPVKVAGFESWDDTQGRMHGLPRPFCGDLFLEEPRTFGALADRLSSIDAKEGAAGA